MVSVNSVLIFILLFVSFLDIGLEFLQVKHFDRPIPKQVKDLYPKILYQRYIKKEKESFLISSVKRILKVSLFSFGLVYGWFERLYQTVSDVFVSPVLVDTIFLGAILIFVLSLYTVLEFGRMFYRRKKNVKSKDLLGFVKTYARKYGFIFIFSLVGLLAFLALYQVLGSWVFVVLYALIQVLIVLLSLFFTTWIVPLFYPLVPLEEGELKEQIKVFLRQEGYQIDDVYLLKDGKRNTLNAFVSGFFKRKRIVLFDALLKRLTNDEIIAVLAHELGHQKKKHIVINLGLSFVFVFGLVFGLGWIIMDAGFIGNLGLEQVSLAMRILVYVMLFDGYLLVARLALAYHSKKFEYQADQYAAKVWYKDSLKDALRKIAKRNIEHLTPHPIYETVYFSHPSLVNRLEKLYQEDPYES